MKIADGYLLQEIVGNYVLLPVGQNVVDYKRAIHLNQTGYVIVFLLQEQMEYDDLLKEMVKRYEASENEVQQVKNDLDYFLAELDQLGILNK